MAVKTAQQFSAKKKRQIQKHLNSQRNTFLLWEKGGKIPSLLDERCRQRMAFLSKYDKQEMATS